MTNIEIIKFQPIDILARTLDMFASQKYCKLKTEQTKCLIDKYNREEKIVDTDTVCKECIRIWLKEKYMYEI